jgi:predicted Rossmann fold nucleotide-binding protein DprA/Smf involved in DNA uptake
VNLSNDAKAVLVLTTRLGGSGRPSLAPGQWHSFQHTVTDAGLAPGDLFDGGNIGSLGLDDERRSRIGTLLEDSAAVVVELESLGGRGIWVLTIVDDDYPEALRRLKHRAPPVLFGVGARSLLCAGGVGVVGSRDVSDEGVAVARSIASAAAAKGLPVVSGGARGVDQQSMSAAYEAGGSVVGVLADSLERRIKSADVRAALDMDTTCLITQQHPKSGFTPAAAMARNKLVYALAELTVVVASDEKGGTWEGATEALAQGYGRVAVWRGEGEGPANEELAARGAHPVGSVDQIWDVLNQEAAPDPQQMRML